MNCGKVYLVGAGPGDPGLLTLRGKELLERADAVVYDRLVSPSILGFCRPDAEMVDVGKMPSFHKVKQSEINELLVRLAREREGGTIVRLKGGDPFVFGRGGEEALRLAEAGVEFEIVPGITSAVAVPAYAGIPVSHRGLATSFHVVTGHERDEGEGLDFPALAKCPGTLVFLMGIANLETIARRLVECGKDPKTPVALVEKGTTPAQRTVPATLASAARVAESEGVSAPAVVVVGPVVELGGKLAWRRNLPLSGKRFAVTRSAKQAGGLASDLRALGAEVVETPMIEIRALERPRLFSPGTDFDGMPEADWKTFGDFGLLAFTSANGVDAFFGQLAAAGLDVRALAGVRIACVGKKTEARLLERGIRADFVPETQTGEGLGRLLAEKADAKAERILLLQGDLADGTLADLLPGAVRWTVYRTLPARELPEWKREAVVGADAAVFASGSAVRAFASLCAPRPGARAFCIGEITAAEARRAGFEPVVADSPSVESLVEKIVGTCEGAE